LQFHQNLTFFLPETVPEKLFYSNSSDRYLHFAANTVRQRGGCKQKSIAKGDFAWIFVRNSEGI